MVDVEAGRYIGDVMYYKYKAVMYLFNTLEKLYVWVPQRFCVIVIVVLGPTVNSTFGNLVKTQQKMCTDNLCLSAPISL